MVWWTWNMTSTVLWLFSAIKKISTKILLISGSLNRYYWFWKTVFKKIIPKSFKWLDNPLCVSVLYIWRVFSHGAMAEIVELYYCMYFPYIIQIMAFPFPMCCCYTFSEKKEAGKMGLKILLILTTNSSSIFQNITSAT